MRCLGQCSETCPRRRLWEDNSTHWTHARAGRTRGMGARPRVGCESGEPGRHLKGSTSRTTLLVLVSNKGYKVSHERKMGLVGRQGSTAKMAFFACVEIMPREDQLDLKSVARERRSLMLSSPAKIHTQTQFLGKISHTDRITTLTLMSQCRNICQIPTQSRAKYIVLIISSIDGHGDI